MSPTTPPPPSGHPGVGPLTLMPHWTPGSARARSALLLCPSSAVALAVTTARVAGRPYICLGRSNLGIYTQHPEHGGGSQSLLRRNLLEGGSKGECKCKVLSNLKYYIGIN